MTAFGFPPYGVAKDLRSNRGKRPEASSQSAGTRWQGRICGSAAGVFAVLPAMSNWHHGVR